MNDIRTMFSDNKWMYNITQKDLRHMRFSGTSFIRLLTRDGEEITDEMIQSYKDEYELRKSISKTDKTNIRNYL